MKCCKCPLFHSWNNESERGESCAIFGEEWDSQFQYEDKNGDIVGCYIESAYIKKVEYDIGKHYDDMANSYLEKF